MTAATNPQSAIRNPQSIAPQSAIARRVSAVIIRTQDLAKVYRKGAVETHALRGVDLEIASGEFVSIMGPSGSGKSTLFNAIGALDTPTAGTVFIDAVDVAQLNADELAYIRCKKIGYIFQNYNLVTVQTCLENVTTPMIFAGMIDDRARKRGMELLDLVGLKERWNHRPRASHCPTPKYLNPRASTSARL